MIIATIVATLTVSIISLLCAVPIIILGYFDVKLFEVSNQTNVNLMLSRLPMRCTRVTNDMIDGWIYGWNYGGLITREDNKVRIKILTTDKFYKELIQKPASASDSDTPRVHIKVCERHGTYMWPDYHKRDLDVTRFVASKSQQELVDEIRAVYQEKDHCVAYVHGDAGAGKSIVATLLAKSYESSLTFDHNPTNPGDRIAVLHAATNPTKGKPLIILLDEADIMIKNAHENKCFVMKLTETPVRDKATLNSYFDKIDLGMYPYVIVIMTSNRDPKYINALDKSYLRPGRVDLILELGKTGKAEIELNRPIYRDLSRTKNARTRMVISEEKND